MNKICNFEKWYLLDWRFSEGKIIKIIIKNFLNFRNPIRQTSRPGLENDF